VDVTKVVIAVVLALAVACAAAWLLGAVIRHGSGERRPHEEEGFDDRP